MASGRKFFTLESRAHRDGYAGRDVDGETMEGDKLWQGGAYQEAPEVLGTGFPVGEVSKKVKARLLVSLTEGKGGGFIFSSFLV